MSGKFFVVEGETSEKLREFSLLSDLLVLRLRFPPGSSLFERVSSGIISILQSIRRPILFVKDKPEMVERILLVFDDRDKSREAFYVAAYYAARYGCGLHILQLTKDEATKQARLNFLQKYLQMIGVAAQIETLPEGELANQLASRIEEFGITTVMMAGYESKGLMGRLFASPVDRVLETVDVPVLVF
jgi:nucleotide-binding universal stress UspA family protein